VATYADKHAEDIDPLWFLLVFPDCFPNENELVETASKKQKTLSSFTPQAKNSNTAIFDHGASWDSDIPSTIIANNFTMNLKEFVDPNWDSDIPSTM
jgi:hypothetical protein